MFKKIQQKSQGGFIGTILLTQVLTLGVGSLFVHTVTTTAGEKVQTPLIAEAHTVDVNQLLITPEDIITQGDLRLLQSIEQSPAEKETNINIQDQNNGLEVDFIPGENSGLQFGSEKANTGKVLSFNLPNEKTLLANEILPEEALPKEEQVSLEKEGENQEIISEEENQSPQPTQSPDVKKALTILKTGSVLPTSDTNPITKASILPKSLTTTPKSTVQPTPQKTTTPETKLNNNPTPTTKPETKPQVLAAETTQPASTPTPTPQPPTPTPQSPPNGKPANSLSSDLIFQMINDHRAKIGKPAFEKEARLCEIAESRGPELYNEIFVNHNIHAGFKARNLPYWITENMVSYGSEQANFNWWMNSSIHRSAIEGDYKYSCGTCWGTSCAQLFTSWVPK